MDINQAIQSYATQPLTHQLLMSLLKGYNRPNDKVHALLNEGVLTSIKKGLYVAGKTIKANKPERFLIANHISGPSYVSMDSALSYHGLIPERVYEVSSMTIKPSQKFNTSIGLFSYRHLPLPYYSFGIQRIELADDQFAMVATPEKALLDKIVDTAGVVLRSKKDVMNYLVDDLRIDEEVLSGLNIQAMKTWLPNAPKKDSLAMIIKTFGN